MKDILKDVKGNLIVSCQALEDEPLHSSEIMAKMAIAAFQGGAKMIRANSPSDIKAIQKVVPLPIIGIWKQDYADSEVYITPTMKEVDSLVATGCSVIAMDATHRLRPCGVSLDAFFKAVKAKYPNQLFMADCATLQEGIHAQELGFDIVSTTLCGYTEDTKDVPLPAVDLMAKLVEVVDVPVIAEGGIWTIEQLQQCLAKGVFAVVIGSAITRPQRITRHFVQALKKQPTTL